MLLIKQMIELLLAKWSSECLLSLMSSSGIKSLKGTSAILQHKKSKLEAYSPTPYGFTRKGKHLVADEKEQEIVQRIHKLRKEGGSLRKIALSLNEDSIPSKNGGRWYASTARYLIRNKLHLSRED